MAVCGITTKGNKEQEELVRLIMDNQHSIVFVTGNAGTGKNYVSLAAALQLIYDKKYGKLFYGRNPVQMGEKMGFLAGDLDDKYEPFLAPLMDNLMHISTNGKAFKANEALAKIEALPIAFLRGRSFENAVVIIDEAQNLDLTCLKTILTRMGKFTKLIIIGSFNQIDDPRQRAKTKCDFQRVIEKMKEVLPEQEVAHIELVKSMRSPLCGLIDEALSNIDREEA